jgi:FkbM family methyltransferase
MIDWKWVLRNRVLQVRRRYEWAKGAIEKDGFIWTTRGVRDARMAYSGHEDYLRREILTGGELLVDVGAHVGTWSLRGSRAFKQVIAFEPTEQTAAVLRKNLGMNNITNVTIVKVALGDGSDHWGVVRRFGLASGTNSLANTLYPSRKGRFVNRTNLATLDSFHLSPDLLKVDVEGYGVKVLDGARETLKRTRKIVFEVHAPDEDLWAVTTRLVSAGLQCTINHAGPRLGETHVIGWRTNG